jgi:hypothetical protein
MSVAEPAALATCELADALVDLSARLAAMECEWLGLLAEFDRRHGWADEGSSPASIGWSGAAA